MAANRKNTIPYVFDHEKLSRLIRLSRKSEYAIAMETGIERSTINRYKNNRTRNVDFNIVAILSDFFKVNMETFKKGGVI